VRASKKPLNALDRAFLTSESRDVMMHVGALMTFVPPKNKKRADLIAQLRDEVARDAEVQRPWTLKLQHPDLLASPVQGWIDDEHFELDYHVRRSALPSPGDERELGILVSRLHGAPLDFHRPPWECHFIEGLERDRIAIYFKVHHSLIDGYTGMRMLVRSLSSDPDDFDAPMFWTRPPIDGERSKREEHVPTFETLVRVAREQAGATKDVGRALMNVVRAVRHPERDLIAPLQAPKSILNQRISRSRRFATQQVDLERVKRVATVHGATVNDVVLTICGSALRRFLGEHDALPEKPLVAMIPVNVRPKDDPGGSGNAVGAILASLATDVFDEEERLDRIRASTKRAKEQLSGMSKNAIMQYSALVMAPLMLSFVPAAVGKVRPAFNVVISNVPGPEAPLYLRGWRLDATYPLSIPFHGYALNITVQSYAGTLGFGFTGCRDTLPHLQRLAVYAGEVLDALDG
jgi:diacylglycerol O-acyltransferase / wax synthase